ncbi:hypothetical protein BFP97_16620 [Roseivirga sp. 4D4]|nr:hypothetical protein BFP97_16620 [Roseivirga sp. 4D4]
MLMMVLSLGACSQSGKEAKETDNTEVQARGQEESSADHDHHAAALSKEETTIWKPSGEGEELIGRDFHFIAGNVDQVRPEVLFEGGEDILQLTTKDVRQAAFVFHNKMGNVGIAVTLKRSNFEGNLKIIHHAQDGNTYEFVSIDEKDMSLGRYVEGKEDLFDRKKFEADQSDWITIRVSAAGTHFKGYLGDENITHGHGDELEAGYVGIMLEGTGSVSIKSIEVTPLEAE